MNLQNHDNLLLPKVGVGLRHQHFEDALSSSAAIDFIEIHSENFFADGGPLQQILIEAAKKYSISLHSTAMGLASVKAPLGCYLHRLKNLVELTKPILMSDHAAFSWGELDQQPVHSGDLLPPVYGEENLKAMIENVDKVQQSLGRQILVENLSSYLELPGASMSEVEFLVRLTDKTECGLLLDLNNILVNGLNQKQPDVISYASNWISQIPQDRVGEIHLAGYSPVKEDQLIVDDHGAPVPQAGWELYKLAIKIFGPVPTLIEWDNNIPSWKELLQEADRAKAIATEVLSE